MAFRQMIVKGSGGTARQVPFHFFDNDLMHCLNSPHSVLSAITNAPKPLAGLWRFLPPPLSLFKSDNSNQTTPSNDPTIEALSGFYKFLPSPEQFHFYCILVHP